MASTLSKHDELWKGALSGDPYSMNMVGYYMLEGRNGFEKNPAASRLWIEKAANLGWQLARYNLGWLYWKGLGGPQDFQKAFELTAEAADRNHLPAVVNLGAMYQKGEGCEADPVKAVELWLRAANQNVKEAQFNLGQAYEEGLGVAKNNQRAIMWYRKAALQGHARSALRLAHLQVVGQHNEVRPPVPPCLN